MSEQIITTEVFEGDRALLSPPADVPEIQRGNWLPLSRQDPVAVYLAKHHLPAEVTGEGWEVARLSQAAYIYRERGSGWGAVAKFYTVKAGDAAERHAARERDRIAQVRALGLAAGEMRAVQPLSVWRGILFLEHLDGLTLEDTIAVRRSRPGALTDSLTGAARFLATLHRNGVQSDARPDFEAAVAYAEKVTHQLAKHGVLKHYPITTRGLRQMIAGWAAKETMAQFTPTLAHGDMTTTNFVFTPAGEVVVIDWERLETADPAFDLGRLMAEVTHSIQQHGGSVGEATPFVEHLVGTYVEALPEAWDVEALLRRARFYRASSTLRIARNGWVSRLDRTALVAQGMALLAER